jgi:hypothetical protein
MIGPILILWNLWLERNRRIFCNSKLESSHLWKMILNWLQETIWAKCDMSDNIDPGDQVIVRNLQLGDNSRDAIPEIGLARLSSGFAEMGGGLPH